MALNTKNQIKIKSFNHLAFQSLDFERAWWRLSQKRVVRTKCDIYVLLVIWTINWLHLTLGRIASVFVMHRVSHTTILAEISWRLILIKCFYVYLNKRIYTYIYIFLL
jgi:hypothetical protein